VPLLTFARHQCANARAAVFHKHRLGDECGNLFQGNPLRIDYKIKSELLHIRANAISSCSLELYSPTTRLTGTFAVSSGWVGCSSTITEKRHEDRAAADSVVSFYLAGLLCLGAAALKLTIEGHWSWWRVLLPLWVVLGHNLLYILVGFAWLFFVSPGPPGEEDITIREDPPQRYEFAAMLCFLLFAHNLLARIEGADQRSGYGLERPNGSCYYCSVF
jgi:hypothetical protein